MNRTDTAHALLSAYRDLTSAGLAVARLAEPARETTPPCGATVVDLLDEIRHVRNIVLVLAALLDVRATDGASGAELRGMARVLLEDASDFPRPHSIDPPASASPTDRTSFPR